MSIIVQNAEGCVLDHLKASTVSVLTSYNSQDDNTEGNVKTCRLKSDLFQITAPFRMDTQFEKIQMSLKPDQKTSRNRKRKRKHALNVGEQLADDYHKEVKGYISTAYNGLVSLGRMVGYFQLPAIPRDNNTTARLAAAYHGPKASFPEICQFSDWKEIQETPVFRVSPGKEIEPKGVVNVLWKNKGDKSLMMKLKGDDYIIPPDCTFLMSDIQKLKVAIPVLGKYDLIVLDPPWMNKSVKRQKTYGCLDNTDFLDIPLVDLMNDCCLVVVWVTNRHKHRNFVTEQLFPQSNIQLLATWYWLKVTTSGECVFELDSLHKKPYETILIGKCLKSNSLEVSGCRKHCREERSHDLGNQHLSQLHSDISINTEQAEMTSHEADTPCYHTECSRQQFPDNLTVISVPCSLHSKKPPLTDVFKPYLPVDARCLELFARNLNTGWTSWGNEVLLHQHFDYYEEVT